MEPTNLKTPFPLGQLTSSSKSGQNSRGGIGSILLFCLLMAAIITGLIIWFRPAPTDNDTAALQTTGTASSTHFKTISVPLPTTPYQASKDGFSVNFPTTPSITATSYASPTAGTIPVSEYRQTFTNGLAEAFYAVAVFHYPTTYEFASDYLSGALDVYNSVLAHSFPGSHLISQQPTQIQGVAAESGVIDVPVKITAGSTNTTQTADYVVITVTGQDAYILSCYGMSQSDYTAFVSSFDFN